MRRFEFVEGSSAKFWMGGVEEGHTFVVVYGRLGTAGTRKEKAFATEEAARKELDKKLGEKLREGYHEVAAGAQAPVASGAKGASAASARLALPPRGRAGHDATPARIDAAVAALSALGAALGKRSWVVGRSARRARRALERISGVSPGAHPALASALGPLLGKVSAPTARLSLARAMQLLDELDVSAFRTALDQWKASAGAPGGVRVLAAQLEQFEDPELAFRVGSLLVDRPGQGQSGAEAGWLRRYRALSPHLESILIKKGTTLKKYVASLDAQGDPHVGARLARLREAAG